jgi:hypothetical protein
VLDGVITETQACNGVQQLGPFRTASWPAQHPGVLRVRGGAAQTFDSAGGRLDNSAQTDPFGGGNSCRSVSADPDPGAATYESAPAPAGGLTLIGSPTITARLRIEGDYPQITARVWDVAPSGDQTMVQHGAYRPERNGVQTFQIHPSGWHFAEGHIAKLELLGRDFPYTQASNGTFAITADDVVLELPVRESPNGGLIEPYAPAALELKLSYAKRQRALRAKKVRLRAVCPRENCTLRVVGEVEPRRSAPRRRSLSPLSRTLAAGQQARITHRLPAKARRALRRPVARGRARRIAVMVSATDEAGNRVTRRALVRIAR